MRPEAPERPLTKHVLKKRVDSSPRLLLRTPLKKPQRKQVRAPLQPLQVATENPTAYISISGEYSYMYLGLSFGACI